MNHRQPAPLRRELKLGNKFQKHRELSTPMSLVDFECAARCLVGYGRVGRLGRQWRGDMIRLLTHVALSACGDLSF
jgi:hypothetical protein